MKENIKKIKKDISLSTDLLMCIFLCEFISKTLGIIYFVIMAIFYIGFPLIDLINGGEENE